MAKYYNAIDVDENKSIYNIAGSTTINTPNTTIQETTWLEFIKTNTNKYICNNSYIRSYFWNPLLNTLLIALLLFGLIVSINVICIAIGILFMTLNITFEFVMVNLFGRELYNKNFPVCSNTQYNTNDCYTTTNTYCR